MLTLEQLFAEMNLEHCDLLKIDCEGGEYEILLSTESRVLERVSTIVCEYHPVKDHDPKQIIDRLSACGFKVESDNSPIGFILAMRDA